MSTPERPLNHLFGPDRGRQWQSMRELAAEKLFASSESARKFCLKHQGDLVLGRKGHVLLVDRRSLDRLFEATARQRA